MRKVLNKRGALMQKYTIQLILLALIMILFFMAVARKMDDRGVKQQILEKQLALFVESASPGMKFYVQRINFEGKIDNVRIESGRVYVDLNSLISIKGYPYFSRYDVGVASDRDYFILEVRE